jgi:hypothetical protein
MVSYGLEPVYCPSFAFVLSYMVLLLVFFACWLTQHKGDLQDASVPLFVTLGISTILMSLFGKRLGFEED